MATNYQINGPLRVAKIMHSMLLAAVFIYALLLFALLPSRDFPPVFGTGDPALTFLEALLALMSLTSLAAGYFWIRLLVKGYKRNKNNPQTQGPLAIQILRAALFESVAIYGLVLGILGAEWQISLAFFVVSAAALVLSFPTEERWKRMMESINTNSIPE